MIRPPPRSTMWGVKATQRVGRAGQVHVDLVVPVGVPPLQDRLERLDAGVGEQDVDPAELARHAVSGSTQSSEVALVDPDGAPSLALGLYGPARLVQLCFARRGEVEDSASFGDDVEAGNVSAGAGKRNGSGASNAACGAGDHGDLPG